ncbi:MAG: bifunctional nuclease family protein [Chloroflexi bacterium]|nr:MAG: bifunctional nuclease family protein [Chloroflexota bacterium]TMG05817.1 MAG: bifunctional nuclease family protein [Chloroflexota bacterium]
MVELTIESIRVSLMNYQRVVILKEKESDRYLPIWIGPAEADAIAVRLQEVAVARPLTHDLLRSIIDSLGASVDYVIVNDLSNDTFFARIMLQIDGRVMEIDSRPSDAIALAVRVQVPIYADESVLEKAGVKLDQEGQTLEAITGETREATTEVSPEELEKLSPFRDVIEGLDLEDFGKKEA